MARKTSGRAGSIAILILLLCTLLVSPYRLLSHVRVQALSLFAHVIRSLSYADSFTTENSRLAQDNRRLVLLLKERESRIHQLEQRIEHDTRAKALELPQETILVPAQVIFYDPAAGDSRIMLNRGTDHGIRAGAIVLDGAYLLGRVLNAGAATSEVLLLNDSHAAFSVQVGSERVTGILKGTGKGHKLILDYIDNQPENVVREGDSVVTSGFTAEIPAGIVIGEVSNQPEKETKGYDPFLRIKVQPMVHTAALDVVFIVARKGDAD